MGYATVADVMNALDAIAPPHLKIEGDPIGLHVGDPTLPVARLLVALDVTRAVAEAARATGAAMIVAHHPLVYHPLRAVRSDNPIGAIVLDCARANVAVAAAHTNWDVAAGGINDVLAGLLGMGDTRPLRITHRERLVKIAVFVPHSHREDVLNAMAEAGAGAIGDYDRCAFWSDGTGTFRALPGAQPFVGQIGQPEVTPETRLEMIAPETKQAAVITAMKTAHPYEEVAYDVFPLANTDAAASGIGRIGTLPEAVSTRAFLEQIRRALSFDALRIAGPLDRDVRTVAVCGGAGAFLMEDAIAAGADVFVTSDVRHHEFVEAHARGLLLIDAGHAATETPGTRELARRLQAALDDKNVTVTFVSADGREPDDTADNSDPDTR